MRSDYPRRVKCNQCNELTNLFLGGTSGKEYLSDNIKGGKPFHPCDYKKINFSEITLDEKIEYEQTKTIEEEVEQIENQLPEFPIFRNVTPIIIKPTVSRNYNSLGFEFATLDPEADLSAAYDYLEKFLKLKQRNKGLDKR